MPRRTFHLQVPVSRGTTTGRHWRYVPEIRPPAFLTDISFNLPIDINADDMPPSDAAPAPTQPGSKYVPPFRVVSGAGESMTRNRDDLPTLRVTNVSEDASEDDLRDLFSRFGKVFRVYIGRDRETGAGKGYAFVSFENRANAEKAMQKVHGMGYDNLILNCQWSREYTLCFPSSFLGLNRSLEPREARVAPT